MGDRATRLWLLAATAALAVGVGLYVVDRTAAHVYLLPATLNFPASAKPLFGALSGFLPSLLHVFAFTLLTATALAIRSTRAAALVTGAWGATDALFELGQHPAIAPGISASLPTWFDRLPVLENVGPYFLRGTFDPADLAATVAGAALAYLALIRTMKPGGCVMSRRTIQAISRSALLALTIFGGVIAIIGSGGDTVKPVTKPPPIPPAPTYLYYTNVPAPDSAVGGLYSVSSDSPAAPVPVDVKALGGRNRITTVMTGTVSAGTFSNPRTYAVVFAANGRLWKQYGDRAPAPVQISNVADIGDGPGDGSTAATANDLCNLLTLFDLADPENSVVIYGLAGGDSTCGTDDDASTYRWVRLSTSSGNTPNALSYQPVGPVFSNTGALTGFVALKSDRTLVRLDAGFLGEVQISAGPFDWVRQVGQLSLTRMLLLTSGANSGGQLRIVDAGSNTLTDVLGNIDHADIWDGEQLAAYDSQYVYFVDNAPDTHGIIQRFPVSGLSAATAFFDIAAVADPGEDVTLTNLLLTQDRVVLRGTPGTPGVPGAGYGIATYPKAGGDPTIVTAVLASPRDEDTSPPAVYSVNNRLEAVSGTGYVYFSANYSEADPSFLSLNRAGAIKDDRSGLQLYDGSGNGAEWSGRSYVTSINVAAITDASYVDRMVVAEYASGASNMELAALSVVDAMTGTKNGTVLGTLPVGVSQVSGGGNSGRQLWRGQDGDDEIFYVDIDVANSLARVTDDSENQEPLD